jgi:hypothetical protein
MVKEIISRNGGQVILVDDEDYLWLGGYKWYIDPNGYAYRRQQRVKDKQVHIYMHREIAQKVMGIEGNIDHIDGDKSNNQKDNLREANKSQNGANRRPNKNSRSKYKGVTWCNRDQKHRARITLNGKGETIGYYDVEEDAARAYDKKALELFEEFAYFNFPEEH